MKITLWTSGQKIVFSFESEREINSYCLPVTCAQTEKEIELEDFKFFLKQLKKLDLDAE